MVTTVEEARAIERRLIVEDSGLKLVRFPKKEKEKLVILKRIAAEFAAGNEYSEPEVNAILRRVYDDYVTIRRYLIEYRFMDREPDGSRYRLHT